MFRRSLDGIPGPLSFTNTVEAPVPDDVYPADNSAQAMASTGPDIYVKKWLSGGEPEPGEIVTFTVEFGNRNDWPWDSDDQYGSAITDTLHAHMAFVKATDPDDPSETWTPDILPGNVLRWGWGNMSHDSWWRFNVVAQITDTVKPGCFTCSPGVTRRLPRSPRVRQTISSS